MAPSTDGSATGSPRDDGMRSDRGRRSVRRGPARRTPERGVLVRSLAAWWAVPVLLVTSALPPLRAGSAGVLTAAFLLVVAFAVARTKTVSWSFVTALFTLTLPWSVVVGLAGAGWSHLAGRPGVPAQIVPAAVWQESLLLAPLLFIGVLAPSRARRFSVTDWLLAGIVVGVGFQLVSGLADPAVAPGLSIDPFAGAGPTPVGQQVLTGLAAAGPGFAVAARRHATKVSLSRPGRILWLVAAGAWPVLTWWLAVSVHAMGNLTAARGPSGTDPRATAPVLLRIGWRVTGQGAGTGWLLLALLLLALLVDAGRLRNAADLEADPIPYPFHPVRAGDDWAGRATRWAGTSSSRPVTAVVWLIAATCSVAAFAGRDVTVMLAAVRRSGPGSGAARWTAIGRGRAAGVMVRWVRADAIGLAADPDTPALLRTNRIRSGAGLLLLATACMAVMGTTAAPVTGGPGLPAPADPAPGGRLGGAFVGLGERWGALAGWEVPFLVLQVVAVLVLVAGWCDLPALRGHDAFLTRRPVPGNWRTAEDYLRSTTVPEALVDLMALLAGTLPNRAATHPSGSAIRAAVGGFRTDAPAFIAGRRRAVPPGNIAPTPERGLDELPVVRRHRMGGDLPPLKLTDGRQIAALDEAGDLEFSGYLAERAGVDPVDPDPAGAWRRRHCGPGELKISDRPEIWSQGVTERSGRYGLCVLALWYAGGTSWLVPSDLPAGVARRADLELDRRLLEFATVINDPANPFRAVEVVTNDGRAADAIAVRLGRLAIPGVVVVAP